MDSDEPSADIEEADEGWPLRQQEHGGPSLKKTGYSLKCNRKRFTGRAHPERDTQFKYLATQKQGFLEVGDPVVSVDTKKKELIGNFKNAGQAWCRDAREVNAHDFPSDAECRTVPYGLYDVAQNRGFFSLGTSADTPEFAVDSLVMWWRKDGSKRYPDAKRLLVLADTGGSNSARSRVFKVRLYEKLARPFGLAVTLCHYPPGASKWNPIEHRLFSHVSLNWAGVPLTSLRLMLGYLRGTRTSRGLRVRALLSKRIYPKGVKVSDESLARIPLRRHEVCPAWNYTVGERPT